MTMMEWLANEAFAWGIAVGLAALCWWARFREVRYRFRPGASG